MLSFLVGHVLVVVDTAHGVHMVAHELGDPDGQGAGRVVEKGLVRGLRHPVHVARNRQLGARVVRLDSIQDVIADQCEAEAGGTEVLRGGGVHDAEVVPEAFSGQVLASQVRAHICRDNHLRVLGLDAIDDLTHHALVELDTANGLIDAKAKVLGLGIDLPVVHIEDGLADSLFGGRIWNLVDSVDFQKF